ncbi:hypothetical protein QYF36_003974 [Acer negundo]|nr:hypothetical protein QYF36_003974 [Acer negundo]
MGMSRMLKERKKNDEYSHRVAALEKERESLQFRLKDYRSDFEVAKTELGGLVRTLNHPDLAEQIEESMRLNSQEAEANLKNQVSRWESDRKKKP